MHSLTIPAVSPGRAPNRLTAPGRVRYLEGAGSSPRAPRRPPLLEGDPASQRIPSPLSKEPSPAASGQTDPPASGDEQVSLSPYVLVVTSPGVKEQVDLFEGLTVIGRGAEAHLILDHPLVSRRHAALQVTGARVQLRDLGSRNGILVNGRPLTEPAELGPGDRFRIGDADFELVGVPRERAVKQRSELRRAQTLAMETVYVDLDAQRAGQAGAGQATHPAAAPSSRPDEEEATRQAHVLELVGPVATKALALGRAEEATRLLSGPLLHLAEGAQRGQRLPREVALLAADLATRLAEATLDPRWVAVPLQIFITDRRPMPLTAIDRLFGVMRRLPGVHRALLDEYVRMLQARKDTLSPAERFALQRLEGLARVAAL